MMRQEKPEDTAVKEKIQAILGRFEKDRSRLIPLLQSVQETFGYLPPEAVGAVAAYFGMTDVQVYGVASFYNHFRFIPLGRKPIQMCLGTACHMLGGGLVLEALERTLDIKVGGITEDGEHSLDRVACVGCCGLAPVMVINGKVYPGVTPAKVGEVLVNLKMEADEKAREESAGNGSRAD